MVLSREYRHSVHTNMTPSSHPKVVSQKHSSSSSSSASRSRPTSSQNNNPSSSAENHTDGRRRRGRQARPSQLSGGSQRACQNFSRAVGAPQVVVPAGFRDFRGWLARLSSRQCRHLWDELLAAIAKDVGCDAAAVHSLKEDIVREIIKCVVVPRPDESAKLVSTNAGRQASHPRSGTTLMVVLEQQLSRVDRRLPQLVEQLNGSSSTGLQSDDAVDVSSGASAKQDRRRGSSSSSRRAPGNEGRGSGTLPSVSDLLDNRKRSSSPRAGLPSFQELDASLQNSGSSSRR